MNNYAPAYREAAREEARLHEISDDKKMPDALAEFNSGDVEAKKKFSKILDGLDYKPKCIEAALCDMSEIANAHTPDFSPEISIRRFLSMLKNHRLFCLINHATCFSGWFLTGENQSSK